MAFKPPAEQPDFADLIITLNTSGIQKTDNALYQTLYLFLTRITKWKEMLRKDAEDLTGPFDSLKNVSFLTIDNETVILPNSRALLVALGLSFDDATDAQRTLQLTHYWTPLTDGDELAAELIYAAGEAIAVECPNASPFRP